MRLFITGVESGIGRALVEEALRRGYEVLALGLSLPEDLRGIKFEECNLLDMERIYGKVERLVEGVEEIDLVILNAGVLGRIGLMKDTPLRVVREVMEVNVWANKVIIDALLDLGVKLGMVVGMSSGASLSCDKGWNVYAISKAGLNCLLKTYANEMPETHFISFSPGLVKTPMLDAILAGGEELYPAVKKVKEAPKMEAGELARRMFELLSKLKDFPSGSYVDIKEVL